MTIDVENIDEFKEYIKDCISLAMMDLAAEMVDDLGKTIQKKFYDAYYPARWTRDFQLIRAAQNPEITISGNTISLKVFMDFSTMRHYRYDGSSIETPTRRSGASFTEEELMMSAAMGFHGIRRGYTASVTPGKFWYEFEKKWNQYRVEHRLAALLRKQGLTVRV